MVYGNQAMGITTAYKKHEIIKLYRPTMFISLIIPCYNVEEYLPLTIQSLRNLNNADDCEFIFINDGSTDNTLSIIQNFAKIDKRGVVIDQPNSGVSAARNAALKIVKGKYILPLDGDDTLRSDAIEIIKSDIQQADLLITPIEKVRPERSYVQPLAIKNGEYTPVNFYKSCVAFPTGPKLVYKSSIIQEKGLCFDEDIHSGEVYTFTCNFLKYCSLIKVSDHYFYQYVMRQTSATHQPNFKKDLSVLTIIDRITSYSDAAIQKLPSFYVTLFRMCMSFTYVKYAQLGTTNPIAMNVLKQLFEYPKFKNCIYKVAFSSGRHHMDRIRALYILTTKLWGYKLIAQLGPKFAHSRRKQFN